jgi:hypothetical protein
MSKPAVNTLIVLGACVVYIGLGSMSGRTSINGGLGQDGPIYAEMVTKHNLQSGSAINKLTPAFPIAAAVAYAPNRNIVRSFELVNIIAFAVLVLAVCVIVDAQSAPPIVKPCAALTVTLLGLPGLTTAFDPGQPYLLAVALMSLAVAACEWRNGLLTGIFQVGATLASPVGIVAPLYGISRLWRLRQRTPSALIVFLPALLVWLMVQYWARGGAAGLLELTRLSRVHADAVFWTESLFILFGVYFVMTSLGGLTILLWSHPRWIKDAVSEKPELLALVLPVIPFIVTAGLDVSRAIPFLLPFWLLVIAAWARDRTASLTVPLVLAIALTVLTQHPWVRLNDTNYFVDWFPYSVHAARVNVTDAAFSATWRVRVFIAAGGLAAFAAWTRFERRRRILVESRHDRRAEYSE